MGSLTNDQAVAYYLIGKRDGSQRLVDSKINPIKLQQYVEGNPTLKAWADVALTSLGRGLGTDTMNSMN